MYTVLLVSSHEAEVLKGVNTKGLNRRGMSSRSEDVKTPSMITGTRVMIKSEVVE